MADLGAIGFSNLKNCNVLMYSNDFFPFNGLYDGPHVILNFENFQIRNYVCTKYITGLVKNSNGSVVENAKVTLLLRSNLRRVGFTFTDVNGRYTFNNLKDGIEFVVFCQDPTLTYDAVIHDSVVGGG